MASPADDPEKQYFGALTLCRQFPDLDDGMHVCVCVCACACTHGRDGLRVASPRTYVVCTSHASASCLLFARDVIEVKTNLFALYINSSGAARDPPADSEVSQAYTPVPTQAMAAHQIKQEQMGTGGMEAGCCPESARDLSEHHSRGPEGSTSSLHFTCSTKSMTCAQGPV